jgi:hypothetical protein
VNVVAIGLALVERGWGSRHRRGRIALLVVRTRDIRARLYVPIDLDLQSRAQSIDSLGVCLDPNRLKFIWDRGRSLAW